MITAAVVLFLGLDQAFAAVTGGTTGCGKSHSVGYHNNSGHGFSVPPSGSNRTYTINLPSSYNKDQASPLIISYHGNGGTSDVQYALSEFGNETYNPDMISVFPQGVEGHWQGASYATPGVDDLKFTGDLLDHLQSEYCIDSSRIYANGKSVGGGFTDLLACSPVGDRFAAFAICSGAMYTDNENNHSNCTPPHQSTPVLEFHGSIDGTIPYDGELDGKGGVTPPIPQWLEYWSRRNGCGSDQGKNELTHQNALNHTTYSCNGTTNIVEGYWIKGMDHDWASTKPNSDNEKHGDGPTFIDATPLIIDFFNRYSNPGSP